MLLQWAEYNDDRRDTMVVDDRKQHASQVSNIIVLWLGDGVSDLSMV